MQHVDRYQQISFLKMYIFRLVMSGTVTHSIYIAQFLSGTLRPCLNAKCVV